MQVTVLAATANPMDVIGIAAGMCYGKPTPSPKRVRRCAKTGHMSVFEHASATLMVEGISRACLAQLTRHRIASYSVTSQRYCKVGGEDWYVMPPSIAGTEFERRFKAAMTAAKMDYEEALTFNAREDARYLLPEATNTSLVMTVNASSLQNFLTLRLDSRAQWEIRELALAIERELEGIGGQWRELIELLREVRK
ncbi:FAD-dependent thymidylate synthase [uncultured Slackia sp.]|uniref:FAD-dependent thymidylate synthase n=1 Tax=uncultured Slackia sp. TaxID=665903 RepID=UPI0026003CEC|nr:FAD-dependent thymidylate synthase [uncultured Slackia sp.]